MPRMPLHPCDHFHPDRPPVSSASENIKLKLMMETLENNLKDEFVLREQLKTINSESLTGEGNINIEAIDRIELTSSDGLIDKYSIYFKNSLEPFIFSVTNGKDGEKGEPGKDFKYEDFTEEQLEALRGPQGEPGRDGVDGKDFKYEDFTPEQLALLKSKIGISFTTDITVGHLEAGTIIPETMTISELLKKILVCEHEWEAADCDSPRTCKLCGITEGEALGHNWGDWVITKPAETGVEGEQQRTCSRCNEVETQIIPALSQPEEPTTINYLSGTFGNIDLQEWPDPFIADWSEEEQEEISMHYVNNMTEHSLASEDELVGRHGFAITTPFVKESNSLAAYGEVSEDPYMTRPAIILSIGYEVTAWNTDVDNSSLSECTVYKYDLTDGRTVYYAADYPQLTGKTTTHYLTISKN